MAPEEPKAPDPNQKLAAAALVATAPNPKTSTQWLQMGLAFLALLGAFGLAGVLVLHGPPSPKPATVKLTEETENEAGETTGTTTRTGVVGAQLATAEVPPVEETAEEKEAREKAEAEGKAPQSTGSTDTEGSTAAEASSGEEGESLANLSKQGP